MAAVESARSRRLLKGVNDSNQDALELVRLLKGIPAKINLIPFNPWPGSNYGTSPSSRIERFADIVPTSIPTFPGGDWSGPINDGWYRNVAPNVDRNS